MQPAWATGRSLLVARASRWIRGRCRSSAVAAGIHTTPVNAIADMDGYIRQHPPDSFTLGSSGEVRTIMTALLNRRILAIGVVAGTIALAVLWPDSSRCAEIGGGILGPESLNDNPVMCDGFFARRLGERPVNQGGEEALVPVLRWQAAAVAGVVWALFLGASVLGRRNLRPSWAVASGVSLTLVLLAGLGLMWLDQGWFMNWDAPVSDSG